jgi:hypothetical protein
MSVVTAMRPSVMEELTLEELLASVLRSTGWIMAGGSAQFRQGALLELQSDLHLIYRLARTERVAQLINVLDDKATRVAANKASDAESVLGLRRVLAEFEQAVKACLGSSKKR